MGAIDPKSKVSMTKTGNEWDKDRLSIRTNQSSKKGPEHCKEEKRKSGYAYLPIVADLLSVMGARLVDKWLILGTNHGHKRKGMKKNKNQWCRLGK